MDESLFVGELGKICPESGGGGGGVVRGGKGLNGSESRSVKAAKSLRALNTCYLTQEVVQQVPQVFLRVLAVLFWLLTPELPIILYILFFLFSLRSSFLPVLLRLPSAAPFLTTDLLFHLHLACRAQEEDVRSCCKSHKRTGLSSQVV